MRNEFTALIDREGEWFVATCPEVPVANGQGRSKDDAILSLAAAVDLLFEDRREEACKSATRPLETALVAVG